MRTGESRIKATAKPRTKPRPMPRAIGDILAYSNVAMSHLNGLVRRNEAVLKRLTETLVSDVRRNRSLLVFGSGHSAIFAMELYHRAGGASFVIPLLAECLLPTAGPPFVKIFERNTASAIPLLNRVQAQAGEMIWLNSYSGINSAVVELAMEARKRGLRTVAFTSLTHSKAIASRHPSGKRLFEVCEKVVDLGGVVGDAAIRINARVSVGPLSSLSAILLGNSIITAAAATLEASGTRCVYTSVNTPEGESRNAALEDKAKKRDFLLR